MILLLATHGEIEVIFKFISRNSNMEHTGYVIPALILAVSIICLMILRSRIEVILKFICRNSNMKHTGYVISALILAVSIICLIILRPRLPGGGLVTSKQRIPTLDGEIFVSIDQEYGGIFEPYTTRVYIQDNHGRWRGQVSFEDVRWTENCSINWAPEENLIIVRRGGALFTVVFMESHRILMENGVLTELERD